MTRGDPVLHPKISTNDCTRPFEKHDQIFEGVSKGFNLGMGFGLHAGWAIEGAVGSMKKVQQKSTIIALLAMLHACLY